MKFLSIVLLNVIFLPRLYSQEACPAPLEKTAKEVRELVDTAPEKFKSIDEFLMNLPDTMKSNFIIMGESRSFQNATRENPRIILTSPEGDVRISFNTDPRARGYKNIEISFWDPINKKFEYSELTFDPQGVRPPKRHGDLACTTSHGSPTKPNWDTYNYWAGVIPFNKDTLIKDSAELGWYTSFLRKTKEKVPGNRLQYLKPIEDEEKIAKELNDKGYMMRLYLSDSGPASGNAGGVATQLFDKLQKRQRCAEASRMSKDALFPKYKYILNGLTRGCKMDRFVPSWYHKVANEYFYATNPGFTKAPSEYVAQTQTMAALLADTSRRQMAIRKDKDGRQRNFLEAQLSSAELADKEMKLHVEKIGLNTIGIAPGTFKNDIGENSSDVANFRYYLEPIGALVSRFSTSIDPTSYSFANSFEPSYLLPEDEAAISKEIRSKGLGHMERCDALAQMSVEALSEEAVKSEITTKTAVLCLVKDEISSQFDPILQLNDSVLELSAQEAFTNRCASCHSSQPGNSLDYSIGGAPVLPFRNLTALRRYINSPQGKLIDIAGKINDRINRPHNYPGAMPLNGVVEMTKDERAFLNVWIAKFTTKESTTNPKKNNQ